MRKLQLILTTIIIVAVSAISCEPKVEDIKVEAVEITNSSPLTLNVGDTDTLRVNILPENATHHEYVVQVSEPSVVSVSRDNVITALAEGTATITAKAVFGGLTDVLEVVVLPEEEPVPVEELEFTFELKNVDVTSALVAITPSVADAPFFAEVKEMAFFENYTTIDEACADIVRMHEDAGTVDDHVYSGYKELSVSCQSDTEYMLVAVGYKDGEMTSDVSEFIFKSHKKGAAFNFSLVSAGVDSAVVNVVPFDTEATYFVEVVEKGKYDSFESAEAAASYLYKDVHGGIEGGAPVYTGTRDVTFDNLLAKTEYVVVAVTVEEDAFVSEVETFAFKTLKEGEDVKCDIEYEGIEISGVNFYGDIMLMIYDMPQANMKTDDMYVILEYEPEEEGKLEGDFTVDNGLKLSFCMYTNANADISTFSDLTIKVTEVEDGIYDLLAIGTLSDERTIKITYTGAIEL